MFQEQHKCQTIVLRKHAQAIHTCFIQHGMIMYNQFTENIGDKKIQHSEVSSVVNVLLQLYLAHSNSMMLQLPKLHITKLYN